MEDFYIEDFEEVILPAFDERLESQFTPAAHAYQQRYLAAVHAVQSGVAFLMERGDTESQPKHLRVGVNSALISAAALAQLLMAKGVFTLEEYLRYQAEAAEAEVAAYEQRVNELTGGKVTLR